MGFGHATRPALNAPVIKGSLTRRTPSPIKISLLRNDWNIYDSSLGRLRACYASFLPFFRLSEQDAENFHKAVQAGNPSWRKNPLINIQYHCS